MEYALAGLMVCFITFLPNVLILILMEYALAVQKSMILSRSSTSLNPYSNGICSCSGEQAKELAAFAVVLILILMEYALAADLGPVYDDYIKVLILILMEYALADDNLIAFYEGAAVLILILMEYALAVLRMKTGKNHYVSS